MYTRTWTQVLNLLGSRDADEIDDASREAHLDFTERFGSILYDVTADPWVLKVPGVSIDGEVSHRITAQAGILGTGAVTRGLFTLQPAAAGGSAELFFPLPLQDGDTIQSFSVSGYRTIAGASVQAELWMTDDDPGGPGPTNLAVLSLGPAGAGIQEQVSGLIGQFMDSSKSAYIRVTLAADASGAGTAQVAHVGVTVKLSGTP